MAITQRERIAISWREREQLKARSSPTKGRSGES